MDLYNLKARVAPALLTAAPILALGIACLPLLAGGSRLWTLLSLGLTTYAGLTARRAGHRVQPELIQTWGGLPTTRRLRFRDNNASPTEITRRHKEVERILNLSHPLPTAARERANPDGADAEYAATMARIIPLTRNDTRFRLLNTENRNYGFSRNLLGLKRLGILICLATIAISVASGAIVHEMRNWGAATPLAFPLVVAFAGLVLWTQVDAKFVKPSAEAYADRLIEALSQLP